MNVKETKEFFEANNVVAVKADKGVEARYPEMFALMQELGNPEGAIPFYAVYGPGIDKPITADAVISRKWVFDSLLKARGNDESQSDAAETAKNDHDRPDAVQALSAH